MGQQQTVTRHQQAQVVEASASFSTGKRKLQLPEGFAKLPRTSFTKKIDTPFYQCIQKGRPTSPEKPKAVFFARVPEKPKAVSGETEQLQNSRPSLKKCSPGSRLNPHILDNEKPTTWIKPELNKEVLDPVKDAVELEVTKPECRQVEDSGSSRQGSNSSEDSREAAVLVAKISEENSQS